MEKLMQAITNRIITKKGVWITLGVWVIIVGLLGALAPSSSDYKVSSVSELLPEKAQSVIAENKLDEYFEGSDAIPAILVFEAKSEKITNEDLIHIVENIKNENIDGVIDIIPLADLPPEVINTFIAADEMAATVPLNFDSTLESKHIKDGIDTLHEILNKYENLTLHVTGPAGIAVDTTALFSQADLVLIFSTVGIILILLIITYRSPLLALIPLLAAGFVQQVVTKILGFMGMAGVELASQSLSIMMILLFAVVIDYSLFIFSRFQEELKKQEDKYMAMRAAMKEVGVPIFYSSSTILGAMLILFFAQFGDYRNFAPIFAVAVLIVMLSAVTLIPTLFTLFGRSAFWPKVPHVGDEQVKSSSLWSNIGRFIAKNPIMSAVLATIFLLLSASNVFNITYEFDTMKSFPDDMPSRVGYDILEEKFNKGDLAPTTILFESKMEMTGEEQQILADHLLDQRMVNDVQLNNVTDNNKVVTYRLTFSEGPYDVQTMDALEDMIGNSKEIIAKSNLSGDLHYAGETAYSIDNRSTSNRDLIVIVVFETIFIFSMLIFLTRSYKMPIYMMGTILLSFLSALGIGVFLSSIFFDISSVSNRVPVYAFVFLVALGIDYNIFLVSRFMEERKKYPVKKAVERAVANTGGVISSAGIVLAATFAVLMTQPVEVLFIFGFIVAIGILLDTFIVRGILMPSLLILFEKNQHIRMLKKRK